MGKHEASTGVLVAAARVIRVIFAKWLHRNDHGPAGQTTRTLTNNGPRYVGKQITRARGPRTRTGECTGTVRVMGRSWLISPHGCLCPPRCCARAPGGQRVPNQCCATWLVPRSATATLGQQTLVTRCEIVDLQLSSIYLYLPYLPVFTCIYLILTNCRLCAGNHRGEVPSCARP